MQVEELQHLVRQVQAQRSESQTIELKAAEKGCPRRLYDTLSSFSNQDAGGVILFGIDEKKDFSVCSIYDLQDLQQKVTEQCNGMEPPVRAVFTVAPVGKRYVCAAEIPALDIVERPCYYKGVGRYKGSFVRAGDADLPMTDYEIYSFEMYRKHLHDDERVVERAEEAMLDSEGMARYLEEKRTERPRFARIADEKAYELLNLVRDGHPTLAAVLNFGLYPQGYFPQLAVLAVVVPGLEIGETSARGARFLDNRRIEGTISEMVEETLLFCRRNMRVQTVINPETGRREDRTEYPMAAIREAVLNALIHRDYSIYTEGTAVQVDIFTNRIEIHSPGGLYGRMRVEELGEVRPDLRNPTLATIAESQTEAESRYSGIPTMRREMKAYGLPAPIFENRRNEFVVTLRNDGIQAQPAAKPYPLPVQPPTSLSAESVVQPATPVPTESMAHQPAPAPAEGMAQPDKTAQLLEFCRTPRTRAEILDFLHVKTLFYVNDNYLKPLLEQGRLRMTLPEKPRSKNQKYVTV